MKLKVPFLTFLFLSFAPLSRADILLDLEGGKFKSLDALISEARKNKEDAPAAYYEALSDFYRGDLDRSRQKLLSVGSANIAPARWLKDYLENVAPILDRMAEKSSEHFILRTPRRAAFLAPYALDALEKAYAEIGGDLGHYPTAKVRVEIYPTQNEFSLASTLSEETLNRSGAIGICKFRRLMILSPEQLAFGYRWLDTLAHEYTHFLINQLSEGKCPLWIHEGTAKYLETRWRLPEPDYLTPGNRTELAEAVKNGNLIPFSRMAPSMVYLKDQTEVRLAFSEVSHAIGYAVQVRGGSLRKLLTSFAEMDSEEAFRRAWGLGVGDFEKAWQGYLNKEELKVSPGAMTDILTIGRAGDEMESFAGTDIRGHLRLGDRMRQAGRPDMALIQYQKALSKEPNNPVALLKSARALVELGRADEAAGNLELCIQENPNYSSAYLLLCEDKMRKQDWKRARELALEANAMNPFNPDVHKKLSDISAALGEEGEAKREYEVTVELREW